MDKAAYKKNNALYFFIALPLNLLFTIYPLFLTFLGLTLTEVGFVSGAYSCSSLLMRMLSGRLADDWGRRKSAVVGICCFIPAAFLSVVAPIPALCVVMRIVQGAALSLACVASSAIAADLLGPEERSRGMGKYIFIGTISGVVGSGVGLNLWELAPQSWIFIGASGCGVIALALAVATKYPEQRSTERQTGFFERSALMPSLANMVFTFQSGAMATFLFPYAEYLGVTGMIWIFAVQGAAILLSRSYAAAISKVIGVKPALCASAVFMSCSMVALSIAEGRGMLIISMALYGAGYGISYPLLNIEAISAAPPERLGRASATFSAAADIGMAAGAAVVGVIATALGYKGAFIACAVIMTAAYPLIFVSTQNQLKL